MVLTALSLPSFAGEVDLKTAADPKAVIAEIEAMNLPEMPAELADQLRGGPLYCPSCKSRAEFDAIRALYTLRPPTPALSKVPRR
jgi:hypothetical protein